MMSMNEEIKQAITETLDDSQYDPEDVERFADRVTKLVVAFFETHNACVEADRQPEPVVKFALQIYLNMATDNHTETQIDFLMQVMQKIAADSDDVDMIAKRKPF